MSAGIDYGMGRTNIDTATGIRYGVISQHSLASWFYDEYEPQYGEPHCPKCGNEVVTSDHESVASQIDADYDDMHPWPMSGCGDYACASCKRLFDSSECYPEEPIGHELNDSEYHAIDCLDSDVMLLKSPYYTYAPFCSPCVPGAGNLDSAINADDWKTSHRPDLSGLPKTYCFSHDYFEDHKAPYRVFRVSDDTEVLPEA